VVGVGSEGEGDEGSSMLDAWHALMAMALAGM